MPSKHALSRSKAPKNTLSAVPTTILDFLIPSRHPTLESARTTTPTRRQLVRADAHHLENVQSVFFSALSTASNCRSHKVRCESVARYHQAQSRQYSSRSTSLTSQDQHDTSGAATVLERKGLACISRSTEVNNTSQPKRRRASRPRQGYPNLFFDSYAEQFAAKSRLPYGFFLDVQSLQQKIAPSTRTSSEAIKKVTGTSEAEIDELASEPVPMQHKLALLKSVRSLEEKLAKAKADLENAMDQKHTHLANTVTADKASKPPAVVLKKEDYLNLVDLYYYSHKSRFSAENTDVSPTPSFLSDYSFELSADFSCPEARPLREDDEDVLESPLKHIESILRSNQLQEVKTMTVFVDLLLDDDSSNRALFEAYKRLPDPGVSYLPRSVLRIFLQRMSTPWVKSEKSMLRYLSLIDDMQRAGLAISRSEWNSAVYLAGRSFQRVTDKEVESAFRLWEKMEDEAGMKASHVTFNILFDIVVRAGKFNLAEAVLKEMHNRGLRLNRIGRTCLIYYYGLKGDGDGVRKAYHDFVEAGEIVDTLVLNCVIASLINAQEPTAAEQIYERMKNLQFRLRKGRNESNEEVLYNNYPVPGTEKIGNEMASNQLGRILQSAPRLQEKLPGHHTALQQQMPLTPDHITFRPLLAYHASTSGNLDRLTVLMNEMTELFDLPFESLNFQLLFKGFALHGDFRDPEATWSTKRLDLCWAACRNAIKDNIYAKSLTKRDSGIETSEPILPSIKAIHAAEERERYRTSAQTDQDTGPDNRRTFKKLTAWEDFVLDLAAFPRERLKPITRVHSGLFEKENSNNIVTPKSESEFSSPFFAPVTTSKPWHSSQQQRKDLSVFYPGGEQSLDSEEGEYVPPSITSYARLTTETVTEANDEEQPKKPSSAGTSPESQADDDPNKVHAVRLTRPLISWLLRAYASATGSRARVEEIWGSARKLFKPHDPLEQAAVVRVLRRCLRDCDRHSNG